MATIKYEAVATVGKRKDGKPNYVKLGAVFESEKGLSLKLDSIPVGSEWNGWISFYPPKSRDGASSSQQPSGHQGGGTPQGPDDDIPFAPRCWKEG